MVIAPRLPSIRVRCPKTRGKVASPALFTKTGTRKSVPDMIRASCVRFRTEASEELKSCMCYRRQGSMSLSKSLAEVQNQLPSVKEARSCRQIDRSRYLWDTGDDGTVVISIEDLRSLLFAERLKWKVKSSASSARDIRTETRE